MENNKEKINKFSEEKEETANSIEEYRKLKYYLFYIIGMYIGYYLLSIIPCSFFCFLLEIETSPLIVALFIPILIPMLKVVLLVNEDFNTGFERWIRYMFLGEDIEKDFKC